MVADTKKVQTLINRTADAMIDVREAVAVINDYKARFVAASPDVTETPLEGNVAALNTALIALTTQADKPIWTQLIAAKVGSHRSEAL